MKNFSNMTINEYILFIVNNLEQIIIALFTFNFEDLEGKHIYSFGISIMVISLILNIFIN